MDHELPYLKHLSFFWRGEFPVFGSSFEKIIRKNPNNRNFEALTIPTRSYEVCGRTFVELGHSEFVYSRGFE